MAKEILVDIDLDDNDIKNLGRVIYNNIDGGMAVSDFAVGDKIDGGNATS